MNADLPLTPELPTTSVATRTAATASRQDARTRVHAGMGKGLERGALAAAAVMGGLTFSGLHMFGLIPDTLIGAILVGLLASAIMGLTGLAWKGLSLVVLFGGRLGTRKWGEKCLLPGKGMQRLRGDVLGAPLAVAFLVFADRLGIPGLSMMKLMAPGELLAPSILIAGGLVGAAGAVAAPGRKRALWAAAVVLVALPAAWLLHRGHDGYLARPDTAALAALPRLEAANPALPGTYPVRSLNYGSGQDRHRPEYGGEAALITPSVDAKAAWPGYGGAIGAFYRWWYGFDTGALPLNGLVWYPEGEGPFPLVLVVHGNHTAGDYSDPGYGYLGEHLASRGFITVSVDQNFLNGWFFYDGDGKEMPVRAWLLLKHLQQWRKWNSEAGNPFYGKVDLDRVALMGHSRGGEAATHAAAMNTKLYAPVDKVAQQGEFGFGIKAVVGIAPPEGQYRPGGRAEWLKDVSYLALYGGHDQDLWWAAPLQQYNRVEFDGAPEAFKALAYIYRANHGQFNTVWGDADRGEMNSLMLNRKPLLAAEEQRTAGKVFITSFLEAALLGKGEYREVFKNPAAARDWLPEDVIITGYEDATFRAVNTNQRLGGAERLDAEDGRARPEGFAMARRTSLTLRNGDPQGNNAMFLEWEAGSNPAYTLELLTGAEAGLAIGPSDSLVFGLATAMDGPMPVGVIVELRDADGTRAGLPLSRFGVVQPAVGAELLKSRPLSEALGANYFDEMHSAYERVLQTYTLPLTAFVAEDARFDPENIAGIRFVLDGSRPGKIYLDQIGFAG